MNWVGKQFIVLLALLGKCALYAPGSPRRAGSYSHYGARPPCLLLLSTVQTLRGLSHWRFFSVRFSWLQHVLKSLWVLWVTGVALCYDLEVSVSPKWTHRNPTPQNDVIRRWAFGRWIGHESRALIKQVSGLIKQTPESCFLYSSVGGRHSYNCLHLEGSRTMKTVFYCL